MGLERWSVFDRRHGERHRTSPSRARHRPKWMRRTRGSARSGHPERAMSEGRGGATLVTMATTTTPAKPARARRGRAASTNGAPKVPHPSVDERVARGRAARAKMPRSGLGVFEPRADRPDPVDVLDRQAATRVPELVPIRYGRMLVSPFAFYRGAAAIMANDLGGTPTTELAVQCCGDAHLSNFGTFASPERRLGFDLNDFDETLRGPFEWDVKRLVASMLIAARDNECSSKHEDAAVLGTAREYRTAMRQFASMKSLDVWYAHIEIEQVVRQLGRRH